MRKIFFSLALCFSLFFANNNANAQTLKVGVFDIELMVQAMPGYRIVDSIIRIYEADTLGAEYEYYQNEYKRLDSLWRIDSGLVAKGLKSKVQFDILTEERRKMMLNIVYWQQISQNKTNAKRNQLAQPLITAVSTAYQRVLARKKYSLILKPETYELGFPIDNIFISVARELKLEQLPQELIYLGDDPDAPKTPAKPATQKPATKPAGSK
jgi:Skp family chaperone for outer membrane proteins